MKRCIFLLLAMCWTLCSYAQNYEYYYERWDWQRFVNFSSNGGGGGVNARINNNHLVVSFNAGFSLTGLRTGPIVKILPYPSLPSGIIPLGNLANGYDVKVENGYITIISTVTPKTAVTGFNVTFDVDLTAYPPASSNLSLNNYVKEFTAESPVTTSLSSVTNKDSVDEQTTYYNGLGYKDQVVLRRHSPMGYDVINQFRYDDMGRLIREYLPYVSSATSGEYHVNAVSQQIAFYNSAKGSQDGSTAFINTVYENSPLQRVKNVFGPGLNWAGSIGLAERNKSINYEANVNGASKEKIIHWKVNGDQLVVGGYYASGEVSIKILKDEEHRIVREYTDKSDKLILKKVPIASPANVGDDTHWASTYYIYNSKGQLSYVLPPEATKAILTSGSIYDPGDYTLISQSTALTSSTGKYIYMPGVTVTIPAGVTLRPNLIVRPYSAIQTIVSSEAAFRYVYDEKGRLIGKKKPDSDWEYMVYDRWGRLVLSQDGNQRSINQWTFTKYDALNRPVLKGLCVDSRPANVIQNSLKTETIRFETFSENGVEKYTNHAFPNDYVELLSVIYYDTYGFDSSQEFLLPDGVFNANGNKMMPAAFGFVKGQVTGTKTKVLGTELWLSEVNFYDNKYQLIQKLVDNPFHGIETRFTYQFDFAGRIRHSHEAHTNNGSSTILQNRFEYDHSGRLTRHYSRIDDGPEILVLQNDYNEVGELSNKKLHSVDAGNSFKQHVGYTYNIRGWLTSINDSDLNISDGGPRDHFGMELAYDGDIGIGTTTRRYNGDISAIKWSSNRGLESLAPTELAYKFAFDLLGRMKSAESLERKSSWLASSKHLENILSYDLNGNILGLNRKGANGTDMDKLVYTYSGNQLMKVDDMGDDIEGFADGLNIDNDYKYDANGNMVLDKNKSISISYNLLNLPDRVTRSNGEYVRYDYDAAGNKLRQSVFNDANVKLKESNYVGNFFYEDGQLKFINHEEGRIATTANEPEYQYHLKDHLGNVRVTFTTKEETESPVATMETANTANEMSKFLYYEEAVKVNAEVFDHTDTSETQYSTRLNGSINERTGLARSISVMPGDTVKTEVFVKYLDTNSSNWTTAVNNLVTSIANGTAPAGTYIDGGATGSTGGNTAPYLDFFDKSGETGAEPKAYLNYVIFDRDYNMIDGAFMRMTGAAREYGQNVEHERLAAEFVISEPGYVYIYLSNDNAALGGPQIEVYFDDFKVEQVKSPIVSAQDYYPFGLAFNSYNRENSVPQDYKYNSKEEQTELNLGWLDYGARMYQPELGRFFTQDRFADKYLDSSPYSYGLNNPALYVDINGDSVWTSTQRHKDSNGNVTVTNTINITGKVLRQSSGKATAQGVASGLNARLNSQKTTSDPVKNKDGTTTTTITKINANFTAASSMSDVSSSDHLVVIVDNVTGKADPKLNGGEAGGQAVLGGQIAYVENSGAVELAFHEVGHNLGMEHPDSNNGNPMSYNGQGNNFSGLQLMQAYNRARNGGLNQGSNSAVMGTAFPGVPHGQFFSPTTTQSRPFMVAPNKRARIPLPLINSN